MPHHPRHLLPTTLALLLTACTSLPAQTTAKDTPMDPLIHAPELPKNFAWLNTAKPLQFSGDLKGQIVVLDFWCYCCVNCMHIIPDLDAIQQKYKDQPVVIVGVHSNKYDNETDPANIRAAVQRYQINHPVIIDENHQIWDSFNVNAWPTLVLVGSDGNIIGGVSGEGHLELLEKVIDQSLADGKKNNTLAAAPLTFAREGEVRAASGLSFPAKVIIDRPVPATPTDPANRLFIVDSNHNRIVITSYPGPDGHVKLLDTIGNGNKGAADGPFNTATFNRPQGAALAGNTLWIADTENHLVRRVDLAKKTVSTALGTGKQVFDPEAGKSGKDQPLNSPWDVAIGGGGGNRLFISQAGQHQIFAMNLMTGMTEIAAGSGRENIRDGNAADANLAQPSGLALDSKNQILYFADSETSSIRALDLKSKQVSTLVGQGLFDFGDQDGDPDQARLQHALAVALSSDGNSLLIADTYNHRIKSINLTTRETTTLAGTGKPGTGTPPSFPADATHPATPLEFFEPAGIAVAAPNEAFVADTNNHRIIRFNPNQQTPANENAAPSWTELVIEGLTAPGTDASPIDKSARDAGTINLLPNLPATLEITLKLPVGAHLTEGAPISLKITDATHTLHTASLMISGIKGNTITTTIPAAALTQQPQQLYITIYYTHCLNGLNAICTPAQSAWKITPTYNTPTSPVPTTNQAATLKLTE